MKSANLQHAFCFTKLYEVLMRCLCVRRYASFKRRMEGVANHTMSASYAKARFVITASWNAKQAYEEIVEANESNRTHSECHQIG
jgi:hypothetical protein